LWKDVLFHILNTTTICLYWDI